MHQVELHRQRALRNDRRSNTILSHKLSELIEQCREDTVRLCQLGRKGNVLQCSEQDHLGAILLNSHCHTRESERERDFSKGELIRQHVVLKHCYVHA